MRAPYRICEGLFIGPFIVAAVLVLFVNDLHAGGGWVAKPWHGGVRAGYNWKSQPGAKRRDTEGYIYRSLSNLTHDYRFAYLSGELGLIDRLEASLLVTYLWAAETVDSTSEDPSHHYHGFSDMWIGAKYQILDGDYPTAVGLTVRLPYLYEASSTRNGQVLTEVPGLLERDWDLTLAVSHSFDERTYASLVPGFRFREGAATHQILFAAEAGTRLPILDDRIGVKVGIDGAAGVGEPRESTSRDRFSGLSLEEGHHFFDFNKATYVRPLISVAGSITPEIGAEIGFSSIVWGQSTVVYNDLFIQLGYTF